MVDKDKQSSPEPNEKSTEAGQNDYFNRLALDAQRHEPKSFEGERALTQLLSEFRQTGQLSKPKHPSGLSTSEYRQISEDTKQETDLAVVQIIRRKQFDPEKGDILNWARFIQSKKNIDACNDHRGIHKRTENGKPITDILVSADKPISNGKSGDAEESEITYLDQLTYEQNEPDFVEKLREIVVENPENIFGKPMKKRQDITLQKITLLWLDGYTWAEISEKLVVKVGTVSSFFNRGIKNKNLVAKVKLYWLQFFLIAIILWNFWDIS